MHYVICYDLENDRLREKAAKLLQRRGCSRVQHSVFVVRSLDRRALTALQAELRRLLARYPPGSQDNILFLALPEKEAPRITAIGPNNALTLLAPQPLKIIL